MPIFGYKKNKKIKGVRGKQYLEYGVNSINENIVHVTLDDKRMGRRIGKIIGKPIVLYQPTDYAIPSRPNDRYERVISQGKVVEVQNGKATIALEAPISSDIQSSDIKKMKIKIF